MAQKSIFGIMEKINLGVFRQLTIFMPEIMSAFCTANLSVSTNGYDLLR